MIRCQDGCWGENCPNSGHPPLKTYRSESIHGPVRKSQKHLRQREAVPQTGYKIRVVSLSMHMWVGLYIKAPGTPDATWEPLLKVSLYMNSTYYQSSAACKGHDQRPPTSCGETQLGAQHGSGRVKMKTSISLYIACLACVGHKDSFREQGRGLI
jgi:hypothetical protein